MFSEFETLSLGTGISLGRHSHDEFRKPSVRRGRYLSAWVASDTLLASRSEGEI